MKWCQNYVAYRAALRDLKRRARLIQKEVEGNTNSRNIVYSNMPIDLVEKIIADAYIDDEKVVIASTPEVKH